LFSRHATGVRLEFYQNPDDSSPSRIIDLDPMRHRTGDVWHVWVRGIAAGQLYGYRVEGPYLPEEGHRFNPHKLLLDPYARAIAGVENWDFLAARGYDSSSSLTDLSISTVDNAGTTPKCIFTRRPFRLGDGFSSKAFRLRHGHLRDTRSRFHNPSEFGCGASWNLRRLDRKDPVSQDLGVTAIELMPVLEFNENESQLLNPITGEKLKNYWGYNPVAFLLPSSPTALKDRTGGRSWSSERWSRPFTAPALK
jgi:isoamylase